MGKIMKREKEGESRMTFKQKIGVALLHLLLGIVNPEIRWFVLPLILKLFYLFGGVKAYVLGLILSLPNQLEPKRSLQFYLA